MGAGVKERLETALINTVEKWAEQSATAAELEALAAVARVLADMQRG